MCATNAVTPGGGFWGCHYKLNYIPTLNVVEPHIYKCVLCFFVVVHRIPVHVIMSSGLTRNGTGGLEVLLL